MSAVDKHTPNGHNPWHAHDAFTRNKAGTHEFDGIVLQMLQLRINDCIQVLLLGRRELVTDNDNTRDVRTLAPAWQQQVVAGMHTALTSAPSRTAWRSAVISTSSVLCTDEKILAMSDDSSTSTNPPSSNSPRASSSSINVAVLAAFSVIRLKFFWCTAFSSSSSSFAQNAAALCSSSRTRR